MFTKLASQVQQSLRNEALYSRQSHTWSTTQKAINASLKTIQEEGTWKKERIITSKQGAHIQVNYDTSPVINFCANNYLGLSVSIINI